MKKNDIFFEIKGKNNDGNSFVSEAIKKGASIIVSDKLRRKINNKNVINVKNSLDFMTKISSNIRSAYRGKIIGIIWKLWKNLFKRVTSKMFK